MLARHLLSSCVRLSVRLSQVGVLQRLINVESREQRHTIAQGLSFADAKNLGEIPKGSPLTGGQLNSSGVGSDRRLWTNISLYLRHGAR